MDGTPRDQVLFPKANLFGFLDKAACHSEPLPLFLEAQHISFSFVSGIPLSFPPQLSPLQVFLIPAAGTEPSYDLLRSVTCILFWQI